MSKAGCGQKLILKVHSSWLADGQYWVDTIGRLVDWSIDVTFLG